MSTSTAAQRREQAGPRTVRYVYLPALVAAVGGFLFGFDTAVINGAIVFLKRQFALSTSQTEFAASSLLVGCVFGAALAGFSSDRFGRKRVLLFAAALFTLSSLGAAVPRNISEFVAARFIGGVAIGIASVLSPVYIAEISPAAIRGRLVSLNQLAIVIGILSAFSVNYALAGIGTGSWRWMFGSAAIPSTLFVLALLLVPESPRWLTEKGELARAERTLGGIVGASAASEELLRIKAAIAEESARLFEPSLRKPIVLAATLAILQQITGINTILYYGSLIFLEQVPQQTESSALLANVGIGIINLAGTIVAMFLVDRAGRRPLLLSACGGMGLSLAALAVGIQLHAPAPLLLIFVLLYVACFAIGMGPGVWIVMAEVFPTRVRGRAMSFATICLWCACLAITLTFLSLVNAITISGTFLLYACISVAAFVFIWRAVPETKGRTLEEIESWWTHRRS